MLLSDALAESCTCIRGIHSSSFRLDVSTFCRVPSVVSWSVSDKRALVKLSVSSGIENWY